MQRTHRLAIGSLVLFALSFVLPAVISHDEPWLSGWAAMRFALSPLVPYGDGIGDSGLRAVLDVASALTNVLFFSAVVTLAPSLSRWRRAAAVLLSAALALNLTWMWPTSNLRELHVGYYAWLGAFALLGLALWRSASATAPASGTA